MKATASWCPSEEDVREIVEGTTAALLGQEAVPAPGGPGGKTWEDGEELWTGCVSFAGDLTGVLLVEGTRAFAEQAAAAVLASVGDDPSAAPEVARDVLGELTNIIGGNIKAMSTGPDVRAVCSIPVVAPGVVQVPRGELVSESWFDWGAHRFGVALYDAPEDALPLVEAAARGGAA